MKANLGLTAAEIKSVTSVLKKQLADHYVAYTKARKYHWNVTGDNFVELHKFFETIYEQLNGSIDEIAERIRALGELSPGTLKEFSETTRLKEHAGKNPDNMGMIKDLLNDLEEIIQSLRKDVETCEEKKDAGTADFLTGLMEEYEKTAWMLRAYAE